MRKSRTKKQTSQMGAVLATTTTTEAKPTTKPKKKRKAAPDLWAGCTPIEGQRERRTATYDELMAKWAEVARRLQRLPSLLEFQAYTDLETEPLLRRYQGWDNVASGFASFAKRAGMEHRWRDVLAIAEEERKLNMARACAHYNPRFLKGGPLYGRPLRAPGLAHEPTNESGVIFAFGIVAHELNFRVTRMQTKFPDCEALREVKPGVLQLVRIEFEYMSRNFLNHKHPTDGCDMIVCWIHNWPGCPKSLEVLELSSIMRRM